MSYEDDIGPYRRRVEQLRGEHAHLKARIRSSRSRIRALQRQERDMDEALIIAQTVAEQTQKELEYRIGELASLALRAIFTDPYELRVDFVVRRSKTEADINFARGGELIAPLQASGGGTVDVAAFALRVGMWTLRNPRSRNTLILDEPFKHLKGAEANRRAVQMAKEISNRLGVQIIMVSDERAAQEDIEAGADKVFEVTTKDGKSVIKEAV